ncbi:MAG: hypothetical protein CL752_01345 [Chloroflexi bacterium]|nr:hypothetical protein [Chloroflexota bacterium]
MKINPPYIWRFSMKQAVTTKNPSSFDIVEFDEREPQSNEVLIKIKASGICGSDLHAYREPEKWTAGRVLGHEIAGEVESIGDKVTRVKIGQRVAFQPRLFCGICSSCQGGRTELCQNAGGLHGATFFTNGTQLPGGFRETLVVPEVNLFPVDDDLDFAIAALAEPLSVAVHGHRVATQLDPMTTTHGERVVILGAGPIGLMSVFYARQAGAGDIAVTARYPQQIEAAKMLGATHVFPSDEDGPERLEHWSKQNPVDLVMETVGGTAQTPTLASRISRIGGKILLLGVFSGDNPLPARSIVSKQLRIAGTIFYGYIGFHHDYEIATQLLSSHREKMAKLITHRVPLEDVAKGIELAGNKKSGSIKVTVESNY